MEILRFGAGDAEEIGPRPYDVRLASAIEFAEGAGEAHAYVIYFEPGGEIGPHEAGFGQIFFAAAGSGWVADGDGERFALAEGAAALIRRGEVHSKGSETGMTALMVQVRDLTPVARSG
jgi:quercetin dioxygenase-like cupin family protein